MEEETIVDKALFALKYGEDYDDVFGPEYEGWLDGAFAMEERQIVAMYKCQSGKEFDPNDLF